MKLFPSLTIFVIGLAVTCGEAPSARESSLSNTEALFRVETVVEGLEVPWSMVFAPDGRLIITERPGRVRVVEKGRLKRDPVMVLTDVVSRASGIGGSAETGLMGLALHPNFAQNKWLYLSYVYDHRNQQRVRIVRFRETDAGLTERTIILENIPAAPFHAGCALRFGPDGKLYATTGDATERNLAAQLNSLAGKTLRLSDDGSVPADNPFVKQAGARPEIWSLGHRNAQGIDWQPSTNLMFQTEHGPSGFDGPRGGDEVNIVEKGKNYGWPGIHHRQEKAGLEPPLIEFTPAIAPAAAHFYRGSAFPQFKENLFFTSLAGQALVRVVLEGRRVISQEKLLERRYGRLRALTEGPDGTLYLSTSNRDGRNRPSAEDDRILRLVPVPAPK
ncbi:MAG: PQQ-dependent sugar dehydrogenase [Acidobacteria bacterium]|nr:PQQ-dependent sugar dehydrogenase [Acidobacteriota bacterium]